MWLTPMDGRLGGGGGWSEGGGSWGVTSRDTLKRGNFNIPLLQLHNAGCCEAEHQKHMDTRRGDSNIPLPLI